MKENKKKKTKPFCTLVVARLSSSEYSTRDDTKFLYRQILGAGGGGQHMKQGKKRAIPPSAILSRKGIARNGGVSLDPEVLQSGFGVNFLFWGPGEF